MNPAKKNPVVSKQESIERWELRVSELEATLARVLELMEGCVLVPRAAIADLKNGAMGEAVQRGVKRANKTPPSERVTLDGIGVRDEVYGVYHNGLDTPEVPWGVFEGEVTGVTSSGVVTVYFPADESESTLEGCDVHPRTPEGKSAAEAVLAGYVTEGRAKTERRAELMIRVLTGGTLEYLRTLPIADVTITAGLVGVNPFRDLKGKKGDDRLAFILEKATAYRTTKNAQAELAQAREILKAKTGREKADKKIEAKEFKAQAKVVIKIKKKTEETHGRKLADNSIPVAVKIGDLVRDDKKIFRVTKLKGLKVLLVPEKTPNAKPVSKDVGPVEFIGLKGGTPLWSYK